MKSAFKNTLICLKVLLSSGARHDIRDKAGMLAIHHSCISGAKDTLKALIERSVITIDDKDNHGNTPLMVASINAHSKTATILIQSRANINTQNNKKGTTTTTTTLLLLLLLPIIPLLILSIMILDTALILASRLGRTEVVNVLLAAGADPTKTNADGHTALTHSKKEKVRDRLLETISNFKGYDDINDDNNNTMNDNMNTTNDSFDNFDKTNIGDSIEYDNNGNREEKKVLESSD